MFHRFRTMISREKEKKKTSDPIIFCNLELLLVRYSSIKCTYTWDIHVHVQYILYFLLLFSHLAVTIIIILGQSKKRFFFSLP